MTLASLAPVRIQLCGSTIIELGGERVEHRLPGRQGRLLFAYLVLNRHRPAARDELVRAIWTEENRELSAAPQSRSAVDQTEIGLNPLLSKLRALLGPGAIEGRSTVRLRLASDARVDIEDAVSAAHRAESQIALAQWERAWAPSLVALLISEREFLPGETADWIVEQRELLADVRLRALEAYAAATLGTGGTELPGSIRAARQLVRLAPLRESGTQLLMRGLSRQGNVAEALLAYASLQRMLRDELGISPSPASQAIYEQLIRS
jgi:SARP family transcriptional regulator, regulator of embCAB operon